MDWFSRISKTIESKCPPPQKKKEKRLSTSYQYIYIVYYYTTRRGVGTYTTRHATSPFLFVSFLSFFFFVSFSYIFENEYFRSRSLEFFASPLRDRVTSRFLPVGRALPPPPPTPLVDFVCFEYASENNIFNP